MGGVNNLYPVLVMWDQGPENLKSLKYQFQKYFQSKSKSGGGECEIQDTDCSQGYFLIHFKNKEAQQRVLKKNPHQLPINDNTALDLQVFPVDAENAQSMGNPFSLMGETSDQGATGSVDNADHPQEHNLNPDLRKRKNSADPGSGVEDPKRYVDDPTGHGELGKNSNDVNTFTWEKQDVDPTASGPWSMNEDNKNSSLLYPGSGDKDPKRHEDGSTREMGSGGEDPNRYEDDYTRYRERHKYNSDNTFHGEKQDTDSAASRSMNEENKSPVNSVTPRNESRNNSLRRHRSTEEPGQNRPADRPEFFFEVTARLHREILTEDLQQEIKAKLPSLVIRDNHHFVEVTGNYHEIQEVYKYLESKLDLNAEKPSEAPRDLSLTDSQADQVSFPSALYEYVMEIYKTEMERMERKHKVKIDKRFSHEGNTYVRFIPQRSDSSADKAKESFIDTVQKAMGDWSQENVNPSVVALTFSDIKHRVRDHWNNIQVIQEGNKDIILRGPKNELSQAMRILEKSDYKPSRPRRVVTISSTDMMTEIPVDARHLDILRKLKKREISDIEQKYNVKMEECKKNGSVLISFRAINGPPDLSPHASHSFITLLQKTFFNIEKKVIKVKPEVQEDSVSILQEQLMMGGIDIVMEYFDGSVILIGHPVHVTFAEEKLNGGQITGGGQMAAASGEPMDTSGSSANGQKAEDPDNCPICLCVIEDKVILDKCKHAYCRDCAKKMMAHKPACAICGVSYGTIRGNQPDGKMRDTTRHYTLPGYSGCGTIEIHYDFPGGIQQENHPHPGKHFSGTSRTAYLPDNSEGRDILRLLKQAFDQRLIFTVGDSRTTGCTDTVTWNDIHHKTNQYGGPHGFGYPDPNYLKRVRDELKAKGVE